jgi:hypothetical protein
MKIRIKGNSVRLRLTRSEVETLCDEGSFSEQTDFNGRVFIYALRSDDGIEEMRADFIEDTITVYIPEAQLNGWKDNNEVGFYNNMPLSDGQGLTLQVEKDFACLDERREDESDNYPNPKADIAKNYE